MFLNILRISASNVLKNNVLKHNCDIECKFVIFQKLSLKYATTDPSKAMS